MTRDESDESGSDPTTYTGVGASARASVGWLVPSLESDLEKRAKSLLDAIDEADGDYADFLGSHQNELVVFFAIASELLDDLGRQLFSRELVADAYRNREGANEHALVDQLGRSKKFELLKHYRVIDEDLAADIERTKKYRGRLVHDPRKRHRITDLDTLQSRIETAVAAVDRLRASTDGA